MKIVLSGVETNNKGAELMLYAILQEIERKSPDAIVYISKGRIPEGLGYVKTKTDFRYIPFEKVEQRLHLDGIFSRLKIPFSFLPHNIAIGRVDYYIDGSGYRYSDQFKLSSYYAKNLERQFDIYRKQGTKIIYLPQAFGPFEKKASREVLSVLGKNATLLMPREIVSLKYLETSGMVDMNKVKIFTDFTSLVEGIFPTKYEHLRNGICIIPNSQMINKGAISMDNYSELLKEIISEASLSGKKVYMLNHAGEQDKQLCNKIKTLILNDIEMVTDLNALEVKGLISSAYLVISSRFHGVASALNSWVPCLATSWSHKYQELYNDYNMHDCILPLDNNKIVIEQIKNYIRADINQGIRDILKERVPHVKEETRNMWKTIWSIK